MAKKKIFYLIDTENVGDRWIESAERLGKKEHLIIFYTENHSRLLEKFLLKQVHNPRFTWLESASGNNALDYQLMGVLSYLITKHPEAEYHIFSNDQGYQKAVAFWKDRRVDVRQDEFEITKKKKKKDKKAKAPKNGVQPQKACAKATVQKSSARQEGEAGRLSDEEYLTEIARAVPTSNLGGWYALLTALLGQEAGREWYIRLRGDAGLRTELGGHLEGSERARRQQAIRILLDRAGLDPGKTEEIYKALQAHNKKDLNGIKQDIQKRLGKTQGPVYYKALKPALKRIKEL